MKTQLVNLTDKKIKVGKQEIASHGSVSLHSSFITDEIIDATKKEFECDSLVLKNGAMIKFGFFEDKEDKADANTDANTGSGNDDLTDEEIKELQEKTDKENEEREKLVKEIVELGGKKPHHMLGIEKVREQLAELKKG